jgi:hypothetical protein
MCVLQVTVLVNRVPTNGSVWVDRYSGTVRDPFTVYCRVSHQLPLPVIGQRWHR